MTPDHLARAAAQQAEAQRQLQRKLDEMMRHPSRLWFIGQPDGSVATRIGPGPDRPEAERN